jgi:hypothetical protein
MENEKPVVEEFYAINEVYAFVVKVNGVEQVMSCVTKDKVNIPFITANKHNLTTFYAMAMEIKKKYNIDFDIKVFSNPQYLTDTCNKIDKACTVEMQADLIAKPKNG